MIVKTTVRCFCLYAAVAAMPAVAQESWELGVAGGYGVYRNVTATNATGEASVGFKPGIAFGAVAGNEISSWFGGEIRYTYRQNDLKASSGGTEVRFDGDSHVLNYDFLFHLARKPAAVRPFLAAGAGVKIYRGTGRPSAVQPLSSFVALTATTQTVPVASVGVGVKARLSDLLLLRVEVRDFASIFPDEVVAPVPRARVRGWLHDIVPMVGLSFRIGR